MGLLKRGQKSGLVKAVQKGVNRLADHWHLPWIRLKTDEEFGPRTERGAEQVLFAMGVKGKHLKLALKGTLTESVQKLLTGKRRRTPAEVARSLKRRRTVRRWRKHYRKALAAGPPQVIHEMIEEVNRLISKGMAYSWGGGHGTPANSGPGDCSWFASRLWQMIEPIATGTTYTLANEGEAGQGKWFTLYIKNIPGRADESHVICRIYDGHTVRWCQTGGRDNTRPGAGPCWFEPTPSRIAEFNILRHPKGF